MSRKPRFPPLAEREHAIIVPEIARIEAPSQEQDEIGRAHADRGREGEHIGDGHAVVRESGERTHEQDARRYVGRVGSAEGHALAYRDGRYSRLSRSRSARRRSEYGTSYSLIILSSRTNATT